MGGALGGGAIGGGTGGVLGAFDGRIADMGGALNGVAARAS